MVGARDGVGVVRVSAQQSGGHIYEIRQRPGLQGGRVDLQAGEEVDPGQSLSDRSRG